MPTHRPRHAITETPNVQEALDRLRRRMGENRIDLAELVILGATRKLELLDDAAGRDGRLRDLAEHVRTGGGFGTDLNAAERVRRRGWARG